MVTGPNTITGETGATRRQDAMVANPSAIIRTPNETHRTPEQDLLCASTTPEHATRATQPVWILGCATHGQEAACERARGRGVAHGVARLALFRRLCVLEAGAILGALFVAGVAVTEFGGVVVGADALGEVTVGRTLVGRLGAAVAFATGTRVRAVLRRRAERV